MTAQDKQLWESIRNALAETKAEFEEDHHTILMLTKPEFDLLYGEANAKCSQEVIGMVCFTCQIPMGAYEGAPRRDEHLECFKRRTSIGQEPDAKVLRHADTVVGWQYDQSCYRCLSCGAATNSAGAMQDHLATHEQPWTAQGIPDREG